MKAEIRLGALVLEPATETELSAIMYWKRAMQNEGLECIVESIRFQEPGACCTRKLFDIKRV